MCLLVCEGVCVFGMGEGAVVLFKWLPLNFLVCKSLAFFLKSKNTSMLYLESTYRWGHANVSERTRENIILKSHKVAWRVNQDGLQRLTLHWRMGQLALLLSSCHKWYQIKVPSIASYYHPALPPARMGNSLFALWKCQASQSTYVLLNRVSHGKR